MKARRRPDSPSRADREPVPSSTPLRPGPRILAAWGALGLLLVLLAYSNHFRNGFHFDDSSVIQNNAFLRSLRSVPLFFRDASTFSSHPANATYRPLTSASFAFDYWRGKGLDPVHFHVTQWLLHAALGVLVFFFVLRVLALVGISGYRGLIALFAAVLFSVHRANTETVNFLTLRSEILSTCGVVGSFVAYQYGTRGVRKSYAWLLPALIGAFAKQTAIVFAPLFALYLLLLPRELPDHAETPRERRRAALTMAFPPFVAAALFYALQDRLGGNELIYGSTPPRIYLQTQVFAWLHYVRLFVLPFGLSADADWSPILHAYDTRVVAGALFAAIALGAAALYARRRPAGKASLYGLLWFYVALIPSSSVFALSEMINEHRPYFPYIGLVLCAAAGLGDALGVAARDGRGRMVRRAVPFCVLILLAHAAGTHARNRVWATDETLWRSVTEASPGNGRAWMNYGLIFMSRADYANARICFEKARAITPDYDVLDINLGILEGATGNPAAAEEHFTRAIGRKANLALAHFYYGRWLVESGRRREAIAHLSEAVERSPADLNARHLLLEAYEALGEGANACALARATLRLVPADAAAAAVVSRRCGSGE